MSIGDSIRRAHGSRHQTWAERCSCSTVEYLFIFASPRSVDGTPQCRHTSGRIASRSSWNCEASIELLSIGLSRVFFGSTAARPRFAAPP